MNNCDKILKDMDLKYIEECASLADYIYTALARIGMYPVETLKLLRLKLDMAKEIEYEDGLGAVYKSLIDYIDIQIDKP